MFGFLQIKKYLSLIIPIAPKAAGFLCCYVYLQREDRLNENHRAADQSSTLRESTRCPTVIFKLTPSPMTCSSVYACRPRWIGCLEIRKGSLYLWGGLRCRVKTGLACHSPSDSPVSPWAEVTRDGVRWRSKRQRGGRQSRSRPELDFQLEDCIKCDVWWSY